MELTLNGEIFVYDGADATLAELIERLGMTTDVRGVAAAVNGKVIPAGHWNATPLHDGDRIEIVTAFQGG